MFKTSIHTTLFWGVIMLYLTLVPSPFMHQMPPVAIIAVLFLFIVKGKEAFVALRSQWQSVLFFSSLLWIDGAGMFYTHNTTEGWIDVLLKMSLLLFPVLFASLPKSFIKQNFIILVQQVFVWSVFVAAALVLWQAVWRYAYVNEPMHTFYYVNLMYFQHPSYFALFVNMAIGLLVYKWIKKQQTSAKIAYLNISLLLFFGIFVVLLQSKAGLISLLLMLWAMAVFVWYHYKLKTIALRLFVVPIVLLVGLYVVIPSAFNRVEAATQEMSATSTLNKKIDQQSSSTARAHLWQVAWGIIKTHPILGVGTGDSEDVFQDALRASNSISTDTTVVYNTHCQYLQTYLSIGLLGFVSLLLITLFPIWYGFKQQYILYMAFGVMITFNLLVESMFERQAGIMFFAFFNAFLFYINPVRQFDNATMR